MPVTFGSVASNFTAGGTNTMTLTLTANAGSVLLVYMISDGSTSVSAINYNGVALTQYKSQVIANFRYAEAWVLSAPSAGINTLSAGWITGGGRGVVAVTYDNAKNVNPFGTISTQVSQTANAVNVVLSVSSTNTDIVSFLFAIPSNNGMVLGNGTQRDIGSISTSTRTIVGDIAGAATVSVSCSASATTGWILFGIPIQFSATPVNTFTQHMLLMGC